MTGGLNVINDGRSYIIKIRFECEDAALAQAVANAYADLYLAGKLRVDEDLSTGLEHAPGAIAELYEGRNHGKRLIRIG